MQKLTVTIHGDPKGQPRPRAYARRMGNNFVARVYDSDVADGWKKAVRTTVQREALKLYPTRMEDIPFRVEMAFCFARPKSHFSTSGLLKAKHAIWHLQKPDCDNLAKLVLDQVTDIGTVWKDDSQVVTLVVQKLWLREQQELGRCELTIEPMVEW